MAGSAYLREAFAKGTYFDSTADDASGPRVANNRWPALSLAWRFPKVSAVAGSGAVEKRNFMLAYDQVMSVRYFGTEMPPLWRAHWKDVASMLEESEKLREQDFVAAQSFDSKLIENLTQVGGTDYATISSLVYRQVVGATQAVWNPVSKKPWAFMKEISSDGDVSTVDVVSPASPLFLYLYPEYLRLMTEPLLVYGNNGTKAYGLDTPYNLAWAPHHLGVWPICDLPAQRQEQMPVEESGNMLILLAGLFKEQKDVAYLKEYWPMLETWAKFIVDSLPDPGNQLCTDDFEGPSPHNVNLAVKGVVGLEAYANLVKAAGDIEQASRYKQVADKLALELARMADNGDHYGRQYNLKGSWSQKYNLMWQRMLGQSAFPTEFLAKEMTYYMKRLNNSCGVPLDDRHTYATVDHSYFTAAFGTQEQFLAMSKALVNYANTTSTRIPLSDWYDTVSCKSVGFRARPVLGGIYAKVLVERQAVSSQKMGGFQSDVEDSTSELLI
eukprot:TRINITY_DN14041_c0_g2_i1.p1 TRINITY_DN14041_c0_g2~~TRINITY_DN14041_c0_g2_i1.p1  ORF type:complete len:515 (-),score=81.71 TRINITY_DN14041_c0_g2_i1:77-1570(-)